MSDQLESVSEDIGLKSITVNEGTVDMEMTVPQQIMANLVHAFKDQLKEAKNYVEMHLYHPTDGGFIVTIQKKFGKSPSQVKTEVERKLAVATEALEFYANLGQLDFAKDVAWIEDGGTVVPKGGMTAKAALKAIRE